KLTLAGLETLLAWRRLAELEVLELPNNPTLGDVGAMLVARAPALANLRRLSLAGCEVRARGGRALAESPYLKNLRRLDLRDPSRADAIGPGASAALRERFGDRVLLPRDL